MKAHHISPLLLLAAACGAHAAEFEVNSTADSGAGSLRAAIEALNAAADVDGQHDIVFRLPGPAGDIVLQAPLPAIGKRFVRLLGAPTIAPGVRPTIYGDDGPVLALDASVEDAEVRNLSLRDGYATAGACIDAGALASDARLLIDDVVFDSRYVFAIDNDPTPLIGAGLYAAGNVTVLDSVFVEGGFFGGDVNTRMDGGGIALRAGSLYVQDTRFETLSVFTDSTITQCGGGAIWVAAGALTVIDSTFFSTYADCPRPRSHAARRADRTGRRAHRWRCLVWLHAPGCPRAYRKLGVRRQQRLQRHGRAHRQHRWWRIVHPEQHQWRVDDRAQQHLRAQSQ